jgi:predicted site-specific integrase-resolvase
MVDRFLCQKQLAQRWGISHRTIENWRYRGRGLPFLRLGGKIYYSVEDIEAYESRRNRPLGEAGFLFEDASPEELRAEQ